MESEIAKELAKTLERCREYFGDDDLFESVLALYRQNPLLGKLLEGVEKTEET